MPIDEGARLALLSDSQATLRQVMGVLSDFGTDPDAPDDGGAGSPDDGVSSAAALSAVGQVLAVTRAELADVIAELRRDRPRASDAECEDTPRGASEIADRLEARLTHLLDLLDASGVSSASRTPG